MNLTRLVSLSLTGDTLKELQTEFKELDPLKATVLAVAESIVKEVAERANSDLEMQVYRREKARNQPVMPNSRAERSRQDAEILKQAME